MKVSIDNIPDEYKSLVKEEMTKEEITTLGTVIMKDKIARLKHKILGRWENRKSKRENREKI